MSIKPKLSRIILVKIISISDTVISQEGLIIIKNYNLELFL